MSSEGAILAAVPLNGIRSNSLGRYLAALGLMRTAAQAWPGVRGAWREGHFWIVGGPADVDELVSHLLVVEWSSYERSWKKAQEAERNRRKGAPSPYGLWLSEQDEETAEFALAHIVVGSAVYLNPLMGVGGKTAGKRDFSVGWKAAKGAVSGAARGSDSRLELVGFLRGEATPLRPPGTGAKSASWHGGSWFSEANKATNTGQGSAREGQLSPWAMLLACEGLRLFAGAPSRRLGTATRRLGAFPFVTASAAPATAGEAGRDQAEVWTPFWSRPMTLAEIRALFRRGRAELGGRGAVTPAAMAGAIVSRGVDAGIDGFTRFSLGSTTSSKTFEPRCIGRIDLTGSEATHASALSAGLSRVVDLCDRLPRDVRKGQQWIFRGLRGPIEGALIRHAGCPSDLEEATRLLDALVGALDRVEANRTFREASVEFDLLPLEWLVVWLGRDEPSPEVRVAMGIASLLDEPLLMHRWGVRRAKGSPTRYRFTKERQPRCVWAIGPLASNLSRVLQRRLIDAGNEAHGPQTLPTKAAVNVCRDDVSLWLAGELDERELSRWIDRLSLFDWRSVPETVREMLTYTESKRPVDGALAFWGLFRPLLDRRQLFVAGKPLFEERADPRTVAAGRSLVARMGIPDLKGAVELAASRYHMSGRPLGSVGAAFTFEEPLRLVSALLFQPFLGELVEVTPRWLRPSRTEGGL